jgi:redox-sensitive bicupin YhaK (pirin superfamily)
MIGSRQSQDRNHADLGWLDVHHTFSFANYCYPESIRFESLRAIGQDPIRPAGGPGPGDGVEIRDEPRLMLEGLEEAGFVLWDLSAAEELRP